MTQREEVNPGIKFVAETVAHEMLCGRDHTPLIRRVGSILLLVPIVPILSVWVLGINPFFFFPAVFLSFVCWVYLGKWRRLKRTGIVAHIGNESSTIRIPYNTFDSLLYEGGALIVLFLLVAYPVKLTIEAIF